MGVWRYVKNYTDARHTTALRQPFNGFIIRQYYNNKFVRKRRFRDLRLNRTLAGKQDYICADIYFSFQVSEFVAKKAPHFQSWTDSVRNRSCKSNVRFIYLFHSRFSDFESFDRTYFRRPDGTIGTMIISIN